VQSGGELFSDGAAIYGPVSALQPAAISICKTTIAGTFSVSDAQNPVLIGEPASGDCPAGTRSTAR
jgi:hypothetical protein